MVVPLRRYSQLSLSVLEVTIVLGKNCERTVSIVFGLDKETNNIQLALGYTTKGYVGTAVKPLHAAHALQNDWETPKIKE